MNELISDILLWTPPHRRAKVGRPARTYIQQLCGDTGCSLENLPGAMDDRDGWRERVREIRAGGATWWWWWYPNWHYHSWSEWTCELWQWGCDSTFPSSKIGAFQPDIVQCHTQDTHFMRVGLNPFVGDSAGIFSNRKWIQCAELKSRATLFAFNVLRMLFLNFSLLFSVTVRSAGAVE